MSGPGPIADRPCDRYGHNPDNLTGFRGIGEGGTIGAPAAIANGVADALKPLGVKQADLREIPLTPERIFRLVEAAQRGS